MEIFAIQKKVLGLFAQSDLRKRFYWTGGTALSFLYLHHRGSTDLDFFSDRPFTYEQIIPFIQELKKELKLSNIEQKKIFDRYEFFLYNKNKLRIEFAFYDFPKLKARKTWQGIEVDSLDDISANKTMAFFDRNDPKDLFDVYFLLTNKKYTPKKLLGLVKKKFGVEFLESSFWSQGYKGFDELSELKPLLLTKDKDILEKIKRYFTVHSNKFLKSHLK